ncbi:Hypothetical cytosolic protein [Lactobacillus helveticus H10]|nr:Hypothetical cytosolic protein [Lactobacillus helveticus H10]
MSIKELNEHIPQYSEVTICRALKKLREEEKFGNARAIKLEQ